jgi:hypothetical protein
VSESTLTQASQDACAGAQRRLRIGDLSKLRELLRSGVPRNAVIELDLPNCSPELTRELQEAIRDLQTACGCREGGIAALITVCGTVVYLGISTGRFVGTKELVMTGILVVSGSLVGKAIGILYARAAARRSIYAMLSTLGSASTFQGSPR